MDETTALQAILEQPTLVKRPLLDIGHERHVGFSAASYASIFNQHTL
jgi:arsenate reductase-like glutaredoxin family protein